MVVLQWWHRYAWQNASQPVVELESARQKLMSEIQLNADSTKLQSLEDILNNIMTSNTFNKAAQEVLNKIPTKIDSAINVTKNLGVTTAESEDLWSQYKTKLSHYENNLAQGINDLSEVAEVEAAKKRAISLQSSLNNLRGQVLESSLDILLPLITTSSNTMIDQTIDNMLETIKGKKDVKTKGSTSNDIEYYLDEEKVTISTQGKIDVEAKSPFIGEDDILKISAKNYSRIRNIHLLSGASVAGLISQWPTNNEVQNYYYNALGYGTVEVFNAAKLLIGTQALAGKGGEDLSNILILNVRNREKPIKVISIRQLLETIGQQQLGEPFIIDYHGLPSLGADEEVSSAQEFAQKAKKVTVNVQLARAYIANEYARKASQQT